MDIDGLDRHPLDAWTIALSSACHKHAASAPVVEPSASPRCGKAPVEGDGTGPQKSYFVRLYSDGTAHCQCPGFYFRGILRRDRVFACKHERARLGLDQRQ